MAQSQAFDFSGVSPVMQRQVVTSFCKGSLVIHLGFAVFQLSGFGNFAALNFSSFNSGSHSPAIAKVIWQLIWVLLFSVFIFWQGNFRSLVALNCLIVWHCFFIRSANKSPKLTPPRTDFSSKAVAAQLSSPLTIYSDGDSERGVERIMKKIIFIALIAIVGWYGNYYYTKNSNEANLSTDIAEPEIEAEPESEVVSNNSGNRFNCDGRIHCSQMTSCEEAKFFINNCPNTKMDGDNDGIPCEKQWCK